MTLLTTTLKHSFLSNMRWIYTVAGRWDTKKIEIYHLPFLWPNSSILVLFMNLLHCKLRALFLCPPCLAQSICVIHTCQVSELRSHIATHFSCINTYLLPSKVSRMKIRHTQCNRSLRSFPQLSLRTSLTVLQSNGTTDLCPTRNLLSPKAIFFHQLNLLLTFQKNDAITSLEKNWLEISTRLRSRQINLEVRTQNSSKYGSDEVERWANKQLRDQQVWPECCQWRLLGLQTCWAEPISQVQNCKVPWIISLSLLLGWMATSSQWKYHLPTLH